MHISLNETIDKLKSGQVVAIATDTVYGLAALLEYHTAIQRTFLLKNRPTSKAVIILIDSVDKITPFVSEFPTGFYQLADHYWPGALTVVVPANTDTVPSIVRAGGTTVGFRIPDSPEIIQLIHEVGPIIVSSANLSGGPAATSLEQVEAAFGEDFPVFSAGQPPNGMVSTIVGYLNGKWSILREGALASDAVLETGRDL